jgi:hypothetical protein
MAVAVPKRSRPGFASDDGLAAEDQLQANKNMQEIAEYHPGPLRPVPERLRKLCRRLKMNDVAKQWSDHSDHPILLMISFFIAVFIHWALTIGIWVVGNSDQPYLSQIPAVVYCTLVAIGFFGTWFQGLTFMTTKTAKLPDASALLSIPVFLSNVHCFVSENLVPFKSRFFYTVCCIPWMTCVLCLCLELPWSILQLLRNTSSSCTNAHRCARIVHKEAQFKAILMSIATCAREL